MSKGQKRRKNKRKRILTPSPAEKKQLFTRQVAEDPFNMYSDNEETLSDVETGNIHHDETRSTEDTLKLICDRLNFMVSKVKDIDRKQDQILIRVKAVENKIAIHDQEISKIKQKQGELATEMDQVKVKIDPAFNPERTIVVTNPPTGGDIQLFAQRLVTALGCNTNIITGVLQTSQRNNRRGVLKIEVKGVNQKIQCLRNKSRLSESTEFRRTYIRSSKSHAKRISELNTKALLSMIPGGKQYRISGSGKLLPLSSNTQPGEQGTDVKAVGTSLQTGISSHTSTVATTLIQSDSYSQVLQAGAVSNISTNKLPSSVTLKQTPLSQMSTPVMPHFKSAPSHYQQQMTPVSQFLSQGGINTVSQSQTPNIQDLSQNSQLLLGNQQLMNSQYIHPSQPQY